MSAKGGGEILALVVPAQGKPYLKKATWQLKELQVAVGGWIESIPHPFKRTVIYGNDEAKFCGPGGTPLPMNVRMTEAARDYLMPGDYIAGDVVAFGAQPDGYDTDVPPEVVDALSAGAFMIVTPEGDVIEI